MTIFALLGSTALWLLYAWLLSAIIASYLSGRKGYGERVGLAFGLQDVDQARQRGAMFDVDDTVEMVPTASAPGSPSGCCSTSSA